MRFGEEKMKFKKSTIVLIVILILYTILSFYKLGRNENPQTFANIKNWEQLTYKIDPNVTIDILEMIYHMYHFSLLMSIRILIHMYMIVLMRLHMFFNGIR